MRRTRARLGADMARDLAAARGLSGRYPDQGKKHHSEYDFLRTGYVMYEITPRDL